MRPDESRPEVDQAGGLERGFRPQLAFSRDDMVSGPLEIPKGPLILIVEDDYLIALDIEDGLTAAGFSLAGTASSADEAIRIALATKPVLALMDIRLLGQRDGIDAALELYREHGIRCIFTTAHSDREVRLRAEAARPLGWMQKPYSVEAVVEAIWNGLEELGKQS